MHNTTVAMDRSKLIYITHFLCLDIYSTEVDAFIQCDLQLRDTLKLAVQSYEEGVEGDINRQEVEEERGGRGTA